MYSIRINNYAKVFSVVMKGTLTKAESRSFAAEFRDEVKRIVPSDYALLIDTKELDVASSEGGNVLEQVRNLALDAAFKAQYSFAPVSGID